jgi:hypothetical protein
MDHKPDLTAAIVRRFIQVGMMVVIQAVTLFFSAGRLNWVEGWAYLGLYIAFIAANAVVMLPHNKELIAERSEIRENAKGWDRVVGGGTVLLGPVMLIVSGLDERFGWSPPLMPAIQWAAMVLIALGYGVFGWAMATRLLVTAGGIAAWGRRNSPGATIILPVGTTSALISWLTRICC